MPVINRRKTLPRKDALSKFGITDRPDLRVQVIEQQGGVTLVEVRGPGDRTKGLTPNQAMALSVLLRDAGEEGLGREIATAAAKAQKTNRTQARKAKGERLSGWVNAHDRWPPPARLRPNSGHGRRLGCPSNGLDVGMGRILIADQVNRLSPAPPAAH
jgi:hypothetical protein